jgi:N-formylglutamate amidohydrolase
LAYWIELGAEFPPALDALREIRNRKMADLRAGRYDGQLFLDISAINDYLSEGAGTYLLYVELRHRAAAFAADEPASKAVFGTQRYVEYIPGELPLVMSVPHGGLLKPKSVADRSYGVVDSDANTQDLARRIAAEVKKQSGKSVDLVISHLHRSKLDPNREIKEAAQGDQTAEKIWLEYHSYIEQALKASVARHGRAFFIDLHGQNHKDIRVELGYMHRVTDLAKPIQEINSDDFIQSGSMQLISELNPTIPYADLLFGSDSLGAMIEKHGFLATPSPRMTVPTEPYFRGGYTVDRHVNAAANVAGLQIEANRIRLRDSPENRQKFAESLVQTLCIYIPKWLKVEL